MSFMKANEESQMLSPFEKIAEKKNKDVYLSTVYRQSNSKYLLIYLKQIRTQICDSNAF